MNLIFSCVSARRNTGQSSLFHTLIQVGRVYSSSLFSSFCTTFISSFLNSGAGRGTLLMINVRVLALICSMPWIRV